jgi:hypothetical protein
MLMLRLLSGLLVMAAAGLCVAKLSTATMAPVTHAMPTLEVVLQTPNITQGEVARTVQIFLATEVDVLIEDSEGKRIGLDFKSRKFVSEIPEARAIANENSTTFVLPFDNSGKPYRIQVSRKSTSEVNSDLSMTGPGFVVGFRGLALTSGQVQTMSIGSTGSQLSFTANQDGPVPQLFLTRQLGRGTPSYKFELTTSLLEAGRSITVNLDAEKGRLCFKSDDKKRDSFTVKMRRTNPGGTRDMFTHQAISFGKTNSYAMDFGQWDGKGEMCFYEWCDVSDHKRCTKLGNEANVK